MLRELFGYVMAAGVLISPQSHAETRFQVVPMPVGLTAVYDMDAKGKVAGVAGTDPALLLCSTARCRPLTPKLPQMSWLAMNDQHTVTGYTVEDGYARAVRKGAGEKTEFLTGDSTNGFGLGIGPDGTVVGSIDHNAFIYTDRLQVLFGVEDVGAQAHAVNRHHVAVGSSVTRARWQNVATRWVDGVPESMGMLPGDAASEAYAINDAGVAVGQSTGIGDGFLRRAVRYADGAVQEVKAPKGHDSGLLAINGLGQAVGYLWDKGEVYSAAMADGDVLVDLNLRISEADRARYQLRAAVDINDAGQIAAAAADLQTGGEVWVRLDPR